MNKETISFSVHGIPAPKGSMRAFMPRGARYPIVTHDNTRTKPWQELVSYCANTHALSSCPWDGPVFLNLVFWLAKPKSLPKSFLWAIKKPDSDKLIRTVMDSLKGIIYLDDAQVVGKQVWKYYGDKPGVDIEVSRILGIPEDLKQKSLILDHTEKEGCLCSI